MGRQAADALIQLEGSDKPSGSAICYRDDLLVRRFPDRPSSRCTFGVRVGLAVCLALLLGVFAVQVLVNLLMAGRRSTTKNVRAMLGD